MKGEKLISKKNNQVQFTTKVNKVLGAAINNEALARGYNFVTTARKPQG